MLGKYKIEDLRPIHIQNYIDDLELNLDSKAKVEAASAKLEARTSLQRQSLSQLMAMKHLPHIELDTTGEHIKQFQKLVGGR